MMTELFYFMYSVYRRAKESDSEAYSSAILVMSYLRFCLFFPFVAICITLTDNGLIPLALIIHPLICWIYSKKRAPKKESCISKQKYFRVPCPKLLMFIINFSFGIYVFFAGGILCKYFRDNGLEGWLLRFFN